jgi:MFS family permease
VNPCGWGGFGSGGFGSGGLTGFVAASALCAAASSAGELIAARAAQGALGAIMLPQVFGLIRDLFEAHEMGRAFGVYAPVMGLSAMLGRSCRTGSASPRGIRP